MNYAYIRVSTKKQDSDNQRHEIEKWCASHNVAIDAWIEETVSGGKCFRDRRLGHATEQMHSGDRVICTELSRLSRSIMDLFTLVQTFFEKGVGVYAIKQNFEIKDDLQSKILVFALAICSETEKQMISERTKMALYRKREQGVKLGRRPGSRNKVLKLTPKEPAIRILLAEGHSKSEIARLLSVDRSTLVRYIAKMDSAEQSPVAS